jgi:hypothetical protein
MTTHPLSPKHKDAAANPLGYLILIVGNRTLVLMNTSFDPMIASKCNALIYKPLLEITINAATSLCPSVPQHFTVRLRT